VNRNVKTQPNVPNRP